MFEANANGISEATVKVVTPTASNLVFKFFIVLLLVF